jgi:hypothetical protein
MHPALRQCHCSTIFEAPQWLFGELPMKLGTRLQPNQHIWQMTVSGGKQTDVGFHCAFCSMTFGAFQGETKQMWGSLCFLQHDIGGTPLLMVLPPGLTKVHAAVVLHRWLLVKMSRTAWEVGHAACVGDGLIQVVHNFGVTLVWLLQVACELRTTLKGGTFSL